MAGLEQVLADRPQVVLLDLGLPDVDGLALISMIRAASQVPIIVITARDDDPTMVKALDAAPTTTWSSRSGPTRWRRGSGRCCGVAAATRDDRRAGAGRRPGHRRAHPHGHPRGRARSSWRARSSTCCSPLASRPGEVVTKRELLAEVWQQAYGGSERTVDVHLSWLRRKLGESAAEPRYLHVVRGVGVRLVDPGRQALMRRRISWLVLATTSTVVVVVRDPALPAGAHARRGPGDGAADQEARNVGDPGRPASTTTRSSPRWSPGSTSAATPTHGGAHRRRRGRSGAGSRARATPRCARARDGEAFTVVDDDGGRVLLPVRHRPTARPWCAPAVAAEDLRRGVTRAWAGIIGLGAGAAGGWPWRSRRGSAAGSASRCSRWPASRTGCARATSSARAEVAGTEETEELARALNGLADRTGELLVAERAAVADLSHRLRTPVTALRLDAEAVTDPELAERLQSTSACSSAPSTRSSTRRAGRCAPTCAPTSDARPWSRERVDVLAGARRGPGPHGDGVGCPTGRSGAAGRRRPGRRGRRAASTTSSPTRPRAGRLRGPAATGDGTADLVVTDAGPGSAAGPPGAGAGSTGLGLDIARRTAVGCGGSLTFGRAPGGGTLGRGDAARSCAA